MRTALPETSGAPAAREKARLARRRSASTSACGVATGEGTPAQYRSVSWTSETDLAKARGGKGREIDGRGPAQDEGGDHLAHQRSEQDAVAIQAGGMEEAAQGARP